MTNSPFSSLRASRTSRKRSKGFTLVELLIVLAIIAVLAIIGLPKVQQIMVEGRSPEVAKALQAAITKASTNRQAGGDWSTASTTELASLMEGNTTVFVTTGGSASVQHDLNTDERGTITLAPGTVSASNDAGLMTIAKLNVAACPIISNSLQKMAHVITVNGTAIKNGSTVYSGGKAQEACVPGNDNTVVATFR